MFEERGACALEGGELREVGVYAGLEGGGGRVEEVEVGFIAWGWVSMYVSYKLRSLVSRCDVS